VELEQRRGSDLRSCAAALRKPNPHRGLQANSPFGPLKGKKFYLTFIGNPYNKQKKCNEKILKVKI
jgi:hypothetical protein